MTTITRFTKEQLLKRLEEQMSSGRYALGFVQDSEILRDIEMDLRLAEIARASLTAEPIGAFHISDQQVEGASDYIKDGEWPIDNGVIEVYTAPPAPVSVPDEMPCGGAENEYQDGYQDGWNACRAAMLDNCATVESRNHAGCSPKNGLKCAAMLQGSQPVSNRDELPPSIKPAPELDSMIKNAGLPPGNSPVTPDYICPCCGRKPLKHSKCSVPGCGRKHVARGLCQRHYDMKRREDPEQVEKFREANRRFTARKRANKAAPQQGVK
ncbi:hypothetical protein [Citrobacter amalonaticus]|uniref:hypothetical protein n=1 Tax=Citrobacter amalonaticus TaxID=35703 RepID=UPI001E39654B|nr:hypothetical protein [Citrobacter amalonaticus]